MYPPIVVMGVTGTGKTTVGLALAASAGLVFVDGDDLHSAANKRKMAAAIPLTDADREPWLIEVGRELADARAGVIACSALRRAYRDLIRSEAPAVFFAFLDGDPSLLARRLALRHHEFMSPALLQSQLDTLEPLEDDECGIRVSIELTPDAIVEEILAGVETLRKLL